MDSADWSPAPVIPAASTANSVTLDASQCTNMKLASALRYGWRETPFSYFGAAIYSVENNLPAPPFIMYNHKLTNKWQHGKPDGRRHLYQVL